jgi:hypothetical protein
MCLLLLFILPKAWSGAFFVAGALLIAHGYNRSIIRSYLLRKGSKVEGVVVKMNQDPGSLFRKEMGKGYAPVVEYTDRSGNRVRHVSTTYRLISPYRPGQKVEVYYLQRKTRRDSTLEDDETGNLPLRTMGVGALLLLLSFPGISEGIRGFF